MTGVTTIETNFNMSGSATATPVITTVGGNVDISGTAVMTTGADNVITGTLTIGTGSTLSMGAFALTVTGVTDITGTISTTSATGTKTFTGAVTVNDGGVWNFATGGPAVSLAAGLTVNGSGTFSSGAGVYTFIDGAAQTLGGTRAITITSVTNNDATGAGLTLEDDGVTITTLTQGASSILTIAGAVPTITTLNADTNANTVQYTGASQDIKADTYSSLTVNGSGTTNTGTTIVNGTMTVTSAVSNSGTLTVTTALSGGSTLTNAASATLNIGGTSGITGLVATASGNTVNYTKAGDQTVKDPGTSVDYVNLGLSGSGAKSIASNTDISGNLTIGGTATVTLLTDSLSSANKLYFGTSLQRSGTHGATAASATYETDTYFTSGVTFLITITTGSSAGGGGGGGGSSSVSCGPLYNLVSGACVLKTTTTLVPAVPATPGEIPGCGTRTTGFSSSTGASCVGNTGAATTTPAATVIPGCGNRATGFSSTVGGLSCVGNSAGASGTVGAGAGISASARTYNLGTTLLKNGSRGEAAKELQRFLNDKLSMGLVVDGIIGPKTIAVIKQWQKDNGLVSDGLIGPATKAKMNASVSQ